MTFTVRHSAIALAVLTAWGGAHATDLVVDSLTANVDYAATSFGGTLLAQALTPISNASYNGIARTAVYDTGTGLDFYYQFTNNTSSKNGVERFTGYDFSSLGAAIVRVYQTDAAFGAFTAGTEMADYADRSALGVVGFSFVPNGQSKINPGTTSFTQILRTDARDYQPGNFGLLNGVGDNAVGFATAVPEPETYAMFLAGLGLMGTIARRRNKGRTGAETTHTV
jgi:hypothetical protein